MKHEVFDYLERMRTKAFDDYATYYATYTGRDPQKLAIKRQIEQFIANEIFMRREYVEPALASGERENDFDNSVEFYARFLYEQLGFYFKDLKKDSNIKSTLEYTKVINDFTQVLSILRLHFTVAHFEDYSRKGILYSEATDEDMANCGWQVIDNPAEWEYLPNSVIESILSYYYDVPINKKVIPSYNTSKDNLECWLRHLYKEFHDYKFEVYFSHGGFLDFRAFLKDYPNCYCNLIHKRNADCVEIKFDYYPTNDRFVKNQMVFDRLEDGTWRLTAYARSVYGERRDTTSFKIEDDIGYFISSFFEYDPIFDICSKKEFKSPSLFSIIYFVRKTDKK